MNHSVGKSLVVLLIVTVPFIIVGILFIVKSLFEEETEQYLNIKSVVLLII